MRYLYPILSLALFAGCATSSTVPPSPQEGSQKHPAVTIETSGDLYHEEGGNNIQMDFFGNCAPGQSIVFVEVDNKKSAAPCKKGRYRYSLNLPPTFFSKGEPDKRLPSSQYAMKQIMAYHDGHKKLKATSYILIDRKRKEVKSVINKQVRYEKIPTGEFEPVTQYNAFGSCTRGSTVSIDVVSPDRYGHMISKYDEKKKCEDVRGYYFLSQLHGFATKGTQFKIFEDTPKPAVKDRQPASQKDAKLTYKNLFNWSVPLD